MKRNSVVFGKRDEKKPREERGRRWEDDIEVNLKGIVQLGWVLDWREIGVLL